MCKHERKKGSVWLPSFERDAYKGMLRRHIYCKGCGSVKGSGRSMGHFYNVLGSCGLRLTRVQRHLIVQELSKLEMFTDHYGSVYDIQVEVFSRIVERHSDYPLQMIKAMLH